MDFIYRVPQKNTSRMVLETSAQPPVTRLGSVRLQKFGCFLLRLSIIERSLLMSMEKLCPTAFNLGKVFGLQQHSVSNLFWDTLYV